MSGPWEKYAAPTQAAGPWTKYAASPAPAAPVEGGVQDWEPQSFTDEQKLARKVGLGAQGVNDAIANTVGAPVDAVAWGLRKLGVDATNPVGGSESIKKGISYVASLPGKIGLTTEDAPTRIEPVTTGERTAYGVGEGVGNALSVMVPAAAVANTARVGTATQGVANVLASQPVMQTIAGAAQGGVGAATDNPWLGLAAGAAVPIGASVARGVVSPTANRLTAQEQRLAAAATREGIPLTPSQQTGSPLLKSVEGTMSSMPGASGPMQNVLRNQREAFNSAALKRAGVTANEASPEVLDRAFTNAGMTFDDLASRTTLNVDKKFVSDIQSAARDYGRRLESNVAPIFKSYLDDLEPLAQSVASGQNPQIVGEAYKNIRSDLTRSIRTASNGDLRQALGGLVEALDGAMERSSTGSLKTEWKDVRREYQALMTVDKAMQGGTQGDRVQANIPFSGLKEAVRQSDRAGFSRGRGQLNELSRVGEFIANKMPDSGTSSHNMLRNPLYWPVIAAARPVSALYNSRLGNAYLTNQAAGQTDLRALYAAQAARQALEEANGGNALTRAAQ